MDSEAPEKTRHHLIMQSERPVLAPGRDEYVYMPDPMTFYHLAESLQDVFDRSGFEVDPKWMIFDAKSNTYRVPLYLKDPHDMFADDNLKALLKNMESLEETLQNPRSMVSQVLDSASNHTPQSSDSVPDKTEVRRTLGDAVKLSRTIAGQMSSVAVQIEHPGSSNEPKPKRFSLEPRPKQAYEESLSALQKKLVIKPLVSQLPENLVKIKNNLWVCSRNKLYFADNPSILAQLVSSNWGEDYYVVENAIKGLSVIYIKRPADKREIQEKKENDKRKSSTLKIPL